MKSRTAFTQAEKDQDIANIKEYAPAGTTMYALIRNVSRSGMSRSIDLYVIKDGRLVRMTAEARRILGLPYDSNHGGVKVQGCGMDMGYHLVDSLSRAVYDSKAGQGYGDTHRGGLVHASL